MGRGIPKIIHIGCINSEKHVDFWYVAILCLDAVGVERFANKFCCAPVDEILNELVMILLYDLRNK